jgi:hypothetical protein
MSKLRDALTAVTERIGEVLTTGRFPDDTASDNPRVIDPAPIPPPRRRSQRERRPPPMDHVMPRMGYRYHLGWTPPESVLARWWRKAARQGGPAHAGASPGSSF